MNIVYVGMVGYEGSAMAIHTRNIAEVLERAGHSVSFLCYAPNKGQKRFSESDHFEYNYIENHIRIPKVCAMEYYLELLTGTTTLHALKKYVKNNRVDMVIFYQTCGEKAVLRFCRKKNVKFIVDRTDWFEASDYDNFFMKVYNKYYVNYCLKVVDKEADGIIAISKFFEDFYKKMGQRTIWLPPVFNIDMKKNSVQRTKAPEELRLVYAGNIGGKKDAISPVIRSILKMNSKDKRVKLDIVGVYEQQLNDEYGEQSWIEEGIVAHGRKTNEETLEIIREADFSILLRQNKLYAKAGFSTKFAESMSNGVPVICTKVDGADSVIDDRLDGVLVPDNEDATIESVLIELLDMESSRILTMKEAAYKKASVLFNQSNYVVPLKEFLEDCYYERTESGVV